MPHYKLPPTLPACKLPKLPDGMFWRVRVVEGYADNTIRLALMRKETFWLFFETIDCLSSTWVSTTMGEFDFPAKIDKIKEDIQKAAEVLLSDYNKSTARERNLASLVGDYPPKKLL